MKKSRFAYRDTFGSQVYAPVPNYCVLNVKPELQLVDYLDFTEMASLEITLEPKNLIKITGNNFFIRITKMGHLGSNHFFMADLV